MKKEAKIEGVPDELKMLAKEARKYKSAEEFVKKNLKILGVEEIRPIKANLKGKYGIKFIEYTGTIGEFSSREEAIADIVKNRTIKGQSIQDFYNQTVKSVRPLQKSS